MTGSLAVIVVGSAWGCGVGFCVGGCAGAIFYLIGAIYGAPIGAIVGLVLGIPASIVLAMILLTEHRWVEDIDQLTDDVAGFLARLVELLAIVVLTVLTIAIVAGHDKGDLWLIPVACVPIIVLSFIAACVLRFAARDLVRTWIRAWGIRLV